MEDEDRRKRRRERNKIAATKCRMKKRERTINLVSESETLETQNQDLKSQVRNLEMERRTLAEMLQAHGQSCLRQPNFQPPVCTVQVAKYLTDLQLSSADQCSAQRADTPLIKSGGRGKGAHQKIPSMSTIKFSGRRSHTATRQSQLIASAINDASSNSSTPVSTPTAPSKPMQQPVVTQHQITTSTSSAVDLGFCEGNDLNMVNDVILSQHAYGKTLSASDCYSISSPDSGFIKSPVDIGNGGYATMSTANNASTTMILKSDYIPNCETGDSLVMSMAPTSTNGTGIEFILKSELVDGDSPYTTVQSADRFLFEGSEAFETDIDQQPPSLIQHHVQHMESPHHHHHQHHLQTVTAIKGHNMLINNNNNNNNNCIIGNHNHNGCVLPPANMINHMQEFNNHCQPYIDYALLKGDFLGQNTEFLTLNGDGSDAQYVELTSTDLDSGVTTYTSMTNSNGCLA